MDDIHDEDEEREESTSDIRKKQLHSDLDFEEDDSDDELVRDDLIHQRASLFVVWDDVDFDEEEKSSKESSEEEEESEKSVSARERESVESEIVNTYQLAPFVQFNQERVQEILDFAVPLYFDGMKYDPNECVRMCRKLACYVIRKVYRLGLDRRKLVVIVRCHEKCWQSERSVYRFLWNQHADGHANFTLKLEDMTISAIVLVLFVD